MASSFTARLKQIKRTNDPDCLFIEPSGMVLTHELRTVSAMGRRDVSYEVAGFVTLIDGPGFDSTWLERKDLLLGQIKDADLVMLSRSDLLGGDEEERIRTVLRENGAEVELLSTRQSIGITAIIENLNL